MRCLVVRAQLALVDALVTISIVSNAASADNGMQCDGSPSLYTVTTWRIGTSSSALDHGF
ncbi:hypothetical protein HBI04_219840 [Parastagonospora nodorum]|nr:hypothetical protein HBI04_219840 [Parastagonospora nodorum]